VAILAIEGCTLGVATESAELRSLSPETAGWTTVRIHVDVEYPDGLGASAAKDGAEEMFAVTDQACELRQGRVVDPFGHH
jgi:PhnB protein